MVLGWGIFMIQSRNTLNTEKYAFLVINFPSVAILLHAFYLNGTKATYEQLV